MDPLPYEIIEAMVQVFGRSFHFKDNMSAFLTTAGVPRPLVDKYRTDHKYPWARKILTDLGQSEDGAVIQRQVLVRLCQLRNLPDDKVPDRDAGLAALRHLKEIAREYQLMTKKQQQSSKRRQADHDARAQLVAERSRKLGEIRELFFQHV